MLIEDIKLDSKEVKTICGKCNREVILKHHAQYPFDHRYEGNCECGQVWVLLEKGNMTDTINLAIETISKFRIHTPGVDKWPPAEGQELFFDELHTSTCHLQELLHLYNHPSCRKGPTDESKKDLYHTVVNLVFDALIEFRTNANNVFSNVSSDDVKDWVAKKLL